MKRQKAEQAYIHGLEGKQKEIENAPNEKRKQFVAKYYAVVLTKILKEGNKK